MCLTQFIHRASAGWEEIEMTDWAKLTKACNDAMALASEKPGRYGGRYVARKGDEFVVLDDDDPDKFRDDESIDILAQATPTKVHAIGRARNFLNEDGSVEFHG